MRPQLGRGLLAALTLALVCALAPACATSGDKADRSEKSEKVSKKKKKRESSNFSLYKKKDLDRRLLKQGERAMHSPALDSY